MKQLARQCPTLRVNPIVADYTGGVQALNRISGRKLVLYIGSSIGNFEVPQAIRICDESGKACAPATLCCWELTCKVAEDSCPCLR